MLKEISGLIPTDFDSDKQKVSWRDVGNCGFDRSFFDWSIYDLDEKNKLGKVIETDIAVLEDPNLIPDPVQPSGFIFHMSRCGSTLLSNVLRRGTDNLVISEADPVNGMLYPLYENELSKPMECPKKVSMLRNLILGLGRKRSMPHNHFYIKFSSWNVLFIDVIRSVFPTVPCLFLYRRPEEVIVSLLKKSAGFSEVGSGTFSQFLSGRSAEELKEIGQIDYIADCLERMLNTALSSEGTHYLNHNKLKKEHFPTLLDFFSNDPSLKDRDLMEREFSLYSKDYDRNQKYEDDVQEKQQEASPEVIFAVKERLEKYFDKLETSPNNLGKAMASR